MSDSNSAQSQSQADFLDPRSKYYGTFSPEKLAFNANLQEFTQKVGYICALETGGKLTSEEAYRRIKQEWKQLKKSKKGLHIDGEKPSTEGDK